MQWLAMVLVSVLTLVAAVVLFVWYPRRAVRMVEAWAARNGYRIIRRKYKLFWWGPFWRRSGRFHRVFHVTVEDEQGRTRRAYVRCGSWPLGLLSDHVTVEWDDEADAYLEVPLGD